MIAYFIRRVYVAKLSCCIDRLPHLLRPRLQSISKLLCYSVMMISEGPLVINSLFLPRPGIRFNRSVSYSDVLLC